MDNKLLDSMIYSFLEEPKEEAHRMALTDYLAENEDPRAELLGLVPKLIDNIHCFKSHLSHVFKFDNEKYKHLFPNPDKVYNYYRRPYHHIKVLGKLLGVAVLRTINKLNSIYPPKYKSYKSENNWLKFFQAAELFNCYLIPSEVVISYLVQLGSFESYELRNYRELCRRKSSPNIYISLMYAYPEHIPSNIFFDKEPELIIGNKEFFGFSMTRERRGKEWANKYYKESLSNCGMYIAFLELIRRFSLYEPVNAAKLCYVHYKNELLIKKILTHPTL